MTGKLAKDDHRELFRTRLADLINPRHELALLADAIDWNGFENEFKSLYSDRPSRPAMPIRLMVGVLMLKYVSKIFASSVKLHGKEVPWQAKFVLSDTTVQGNHTTFPTDAKLCKKVIDKCNQIAEKECITQRCKYRKESKQLLQATYNGLHP